MADILVEADKIDGEGDRHCSDCDAWGGSWMSVTTDTPSVWPGCGPCNTSRGAQDKVLARNRASSFADRPIGTDASDGEDRRWA